MYLAMKDEACTFARECAPPPPPKAFENRLRARFGAPVLCSVSSLGGIDDTRPYFVRAYFRDGDMRRPYGGRTGPNRAEPGLAVVAVKMFLPADPVAEVAAAPAADATGPATLPRAGESSGDQAEP